MSYALNLLSVVPVRKEASHKSEQVSELLFGEFAEILKEKDGFYQVKCLYDNYPGWVQTKQVKKVEEIRETPEYTGVFCTSVYVNDQLVRAPFGSPIYDLEKFAADMDGWQIRYELTKKTLWDTRDVAFVEHNLSTIYSVYLNVPYVWGGKSVNGTDCSGFVQQVYKMFGVKIPRDSAQQAEQGKQVKYLGSARLGDLAFFEDKSGKVIHVGMIVEDKKIVHASGCVRKDSLDKDGIFDTETGERTHKLHSIKRYF